MAELPFHLLQLADSASPTGGFAHSYGVEELCRAQVIGDAGDLLAAVTSYVEGSLAGRELVFVALGYDAATVGDTEALAALAVRHVATRLTRAARQSEGGRGRALQRTLEAMHGPSVLWAAAAGSYGVGFGAAGAVFGADRRHVLAASAFAHVSAMTQAAVRLGRVGPLAAQEVLARLARPLETAVADAELRRFGDWYGCCPLWELAQARHEHFPARMFVT